MTARVNELTMAGERIALVPTMGYFHQGHLALMEEGKRLAHKVVVSLFVNPIQFGVGEDLNRYPRDFARDCQLAEDVGVDLLFAPVADSMYGQGFQTSVSVGHLSSGLCGASRPGHFDGVATVVAKLFHIVKPHVAVFGSKDFQQVAVIRQMVADLNWDIKIISHPIVREMDGLAMSSRNKYLDQSQRKQALALFRSLALARQEVAEGCHDPTLLREKIEDFLSSADGVEVDYIAIIDAGDLRPGKIVDENSVLALAARVGSTRLIDNGFLIDD